MRKRAAPDRKERNERRDALASVASTFKAFRPAREVLTRVRAVPTIFCQFDHAARVGGLPVERFMLLHGPSNMGKALADGTPVLTPAGWEPIDSLKPGEMVIASDGTPAQVEGVYPQGVKQLFEVRFNDGSTIECCAEHLWFTTTPKERNRGHNVRGPRPERKRISTGVEGKGSVKSLAEILEDFQPGEHAIPLAAPVEYEPLGPLPLDSYLLGLLLGDGGFTQATTAFHNPEQDLRDSMTARLPLGDEVAARDDLTIAITGGARGRSTGSSTRRALRQLDLDGLGSHEKFIPTIYMRAPLEDRLAMLRGLLDTDGHVTKEGTLVEYTSTSFQLAADVAELARSIGAFVSMDDARVTQFTHHGEKRDGKPSVRMRIGFIDDTIPVASEKHLARWKGRTKMRYRTIEAITPSRRAHATCISVDSPDRTFVTKDFIVTHNTSFSLGLLRSFLARDHFALLIDAERTTPIDWCEKMMGPLADHPGFLAKRPTTYEDTILEVRNFLNAIATARAKGKIPDDTAALIVVDSLRKLVPADVMKEILSDKDETKAGRDRGAQLKAKMNAAWMDELTPLLEAGQAGFIAIAREMQDPDADMWARKFKTDYKIGGGSAIYFDASLVMRCERAEWISHGEGKERQVYGEKTRVTIKKTKVAGKDDKVAVGFFNTSNGVLIPEGFDAARDLLQLGERLGVVTKKGSSLCFDGERMGSGEHAAVKMLTKDPDRLAQLDAAVRASFALAPPIEHDPFTGELG